MNQNEKLMKNIKRMEINSKLFDNVKTQDNIKESKEQDSIPNIKSEDEKLQEKISNINLNEFI